MRSLQKLLLGLAIACATAFPRAAQATEPEEVVVVDVDDSAAALDAAKLRAAVGDELHAIAVAPGDPRAAAAKGTLRVEASEPKHAMRITYLARATPTVRTVALPADPDAARREAVLVAGNLARDEGAELARELRRKKEAAPPEPADAANPLRSRRNVRSLLEFYAAQDRAANRGILFGVLGVAAGSAAIGTAA